MMISSHCAYTVISLVIVDELLNSFPEPFAEVFHPMKLNQFMDALTPLKVGELFSLTNSEVLLPDVPPLAS